MAFHTFVTFGQEPVEELAIACAVGVVGEHRLKQRHKSGSISVLSHVVLDSPIVPWKATY